MAKHLRWFRDTPWGAQIARIVYTLGPLEHANHSVLTDYRWVAITVMEDPNSAGEMLVHVRGRCRVTRSWPPSAVELGRLRSVASHLFSNFGPGEPTRGTAGGAARRASS